MGPVFCVFGRTSNGYEQRVDVILFSCPSSDPPSQTALTDTSAACWSLSDMKTKSSAAH